MNGANQWAKQLGLAISPLFRPRSADFPGEHFAMLDGRRASFACSSVDLPDIPIDQSKDWRWSADLAHHVLITPSEVHVRSGYEPSPRRFRRSSVDDRLEEFIRFLDSSRESMLPDVVSFLVREFKGIWAASNSPDGQSALAAFLLALYSAGENDPSVLRDPQWRRTTTLEIGIDDLVGLGAGLSAAAIEQGEGIRSRTPAGLHLVPQLVLRHAAGRLFQEAHALLESAQLGLFGGSSITTSPTYSVSGAYFTPIPLARVLAEWALASWSTLPNELTVADFACGSAVFLTEAMRALEQRGFEGTLRLVGRDKSPQAVTMAKVAVQSARHDMSSGNIVVDIRQADAFDELWPQADIVLMNPPFRSWEQMNSREREWVRETSSTLDRGRPDLSVGFVERALRALRPSGLLATLLPAGVLASDGLQKWREGLIERTTPTLVAVLGEHGLFQHALVNVGMLTLKNAPSSPVPSPMKPILHIAWSSAETGSASRAIRAIRRSITDESLRVSRDEVDGWSVTATSLDVLKTKPSWLPGAGALGPLLETIQTSITTRVSDLFKVQQGIRTGANEVFLQPRQVVQRLPEREQIYFKTAVDTASFVNGEIVSQTYLFLPDDKWSSEAEVKKTVPNFFNHHLLPNKDTLSKRRSLKDHRWWILIRSRKWAFEGPPRLVSKRFGLYPAFARDLRVHFAPVQANAWIPTELLSSAGGKDSLRGLLTSYWWLLNSRIAVALLREYCPNVAGGQLDLEHKYVAHVPLPNLEIQLRESPALQMLETSIRSRNGEHLPPLSDLDQFAATAFGTDVADWNLSGLGLPR